MSDDGGVQSSVEALPLAERGPVPAPTPNPNVADDRPPVPTGVWWRGALAGAIAIVIAVVALVSLWLLARPLALVFAAIAIAEALAPIVDQLERKLPRVLSILLVYVALIAGLTGLGLFIVPQLVDQAQELRQDTPEILLRIPELFDQWSPVEDGQIIDVAQQNLDRFSGVLVGIPVRIVSSVVQLVLVLVMSVYWLITAPSLGRFFRSLFPTRMLPEVDHVLHELQQSVGGYVRGQVMVAFAVGGITYVGLTILGVEYAVVLALLATIGELIPIVGPILAAIPAVAVALMDSPTQALIVAAFYIVLQQVESNVFVPQAMRRTAEVPPLLSLIAIYVGGSLGGFLGVLVAIPMAGALKVLLTTVLAPAIRRWADRPEAVLGATGGKLP
jgi:putative heme transporter